MAITVTVVKGKEKAEEESEPGGEVLRYEGTVASFSSSTLVLGRVLELYRTEGFLWRVVDEDELTFDITGAEIDGTLANDAKVNISAEDSPDGLVAIRVSVFQVP